MHGDLRVRDQDVVEPPLLDGEEIHVGRGHHRGRPSLPREEGHLAEEVALRQPRERPLRLAQALPDLDLPAVDDAEAVAVVSLLDDPLARRVV